MPTEPTASKFQTFELFKDGDGYTPIPHFFREMQRKYRLPPAFWNTLFFIFDETIGKTRAGVSGQLAQSQIPGDAHEVGKWIAALDVFGGLLTVEYADYRSQRGSRFILNPDATPDDWEHFFYMLTVAYMEGYFRRKVKDGDAEVRNSVERVREFFKTWRYPAGT